MQLTAQAVGAFEQKMTSPRRAKEKTPSRMMMFDSDLDREPTAKPTNLRRRAFLASAAVAIGGLTLWQWKRPAVLNAAAALPEPKDVTVVLFSDSGQRLKTVRIPKVIKTPDRMAQPTRRRSLRHHPQRRHRNRLHRKILEPARQRHLSLHLLRQRALRFSDQIRVRHRMAQFLGAHRPRERNRNPRHHSRHGPHRHRLHRMRRSPRPRLRRRPRAHRSSLLHELSLAALCEANVMGP